MRKEGTKLFKKTPLTKKHIEILTLFHSLQIAGSGKTKADRIKEVQQRLKKYTESSILNIVNRYYSLFTESLEELENISQNLTKEGLTKTYNLENLSTMQIDFIYYFLKGMKPSEAAEKAGYKHPRAAASKLVRKKKIQAVFEEQRRIYLETSKFGFAEVLETLKEIICKGAEDKSSYNAAINGISVWADLMGAKASDAVREKMVDIKKSELSLKKKDIAVKEGILALEKEKAREQIENYEKKVNRKVTVEVVKAKNENS